MKDVVQNIAREVGAEVSFSAAAAVKSWVVPLLAGLGITMAVNEFFGGLFLAVAAAAIMRRRDRRRGKGIAIYSALTAVLLALVTAGLLSHYDIAFPKWIAMTAVGFFSRNIVNWLSHFGDRAEKSGSDVADKVIDRLTGEDK